jgi:hypothetical protein
MSSEDDQPPKVIDHPKHMLLVVLAALIPYPVQTTYMDRLLALLAVYLRAEVLTWILSPPKIPR